MAELNQCTAGYFIIGQSGSLFSADGYNWMPIAFKKPASDNNAVAIPISYTDGKLFMFDGVGTMSVFTVSDYDPQTQIQLPNIKSTKPGVNCYLKAA
ncbi:hypothetical protein DFW101_1405 [Solidesulfovibrio carbinoliphilus subsp. oakridgensis]|nr:hypothetical protein [Solidesulfovibrio carbinoliphilus]EHJ47413.1 hypothetical protein DFW101_1405 [Solidesulfovibrio carbinoliphilus subsp. oakridgensis]